VIFRFRPGEKWNIVDHEPGNPAKKQISASIYQELKNKKVF